MANEAELAALRETCDILIEKAREWYKTATPEQKKAMHEAQRESWVRAEAHFDESPNETPSPAQIDVTIGYLNHRGEFSLRKIRPYHLVFTESEYYPGPARWFIHAYCHTKRAPRLFALDRIGCTKSYIDPEPGR